MRDITPLLINLLCALVFAHAFLPRPPLWARVTIAGVTIPAFGFLMFRFLYHPIPVPIGRGLEFALNLGSAALLLAVCFTFLIRRPWERWTKVE